MYRKPISRNLPSSTGKTQSPHNDSPMGTPGLDLFHPDNGSAFHFQRALYFRHKLFSILALLLCAVSATGSLGAAESQPVPLGKLDTFWRNGAALGPILETGYALEQIPDYTSKGDFPYKKRPFPKEVPFADRLSIVRLLGGGTGNGRKGRNSGDPGADDLVYRNADGTLGYRMNLVKPRLQPYIDQGYTDLTLVLDNVPWCLPEEPKPGSRFGQNVPPRDPQEWHDFIKELCLEVKNIMGPEAAGKLRFRVGTENNARIRFDGTPEQFLQHYDAAARAVKEVLPTAKVGAFNIASVNVHALDSAHNVNAFKLAEHCLETPLTPGSKEHLPFDWVAFSRYFRPGENLEDNASACGEVWNEFEKRMPALKGISREIHEFGIAPWGEVASDQFPSGETGVLGASLTCEMMWRLKEAGINRLWHWPVDEKFSTRDGKSEILFGGKAWVLSIMEYMAGGDTWLFRPLEPSPAHATYLMAGSFKNDRALLMISANNEDIANHTAETVQFRIPPTLLQPGKKTVREVHLTKETSPFDRIRVDLDAAGLLQPDFKSRPDRLGSVKKQMGAGDEAEELVADKMDTYVKLWTDSLTLKPLTPAIGKVESDANGTLVSVNLTAPEVLVLEVR